MRKTLIFILSALPSFLFAQVSYRPSDTFFFNGGLNVADNPQRIAPNQSPDMSNFVCDDESSYVRNASKRFNNTALSSNPVTSIYRAYANSGKKRFLAMSEDEIYYSTATESIDWNRFSNTGGDSGDVWISTYAGLKHNQKFQFATYNDIVYMVNGTTDPLRYNIDVDTITFVGGDPPIAKFILNHGDYMLMARTTDFPNRVYYSDAGDVESWPINNTIDFETKSGDPITGISNMVGGVRIYLMNTIWNLTFTVLSTDIDADQVKIKAFDGFGCIAPYSLCSFGDGDFFLARDGFRVLVGGNTAIVSRPVEPIIKRIIDAGTYDTTVCHFDKKNKWIWVSYQDNIAYPKGVNNSILIYDMKNSQWYAFDGIFGDSFCQWDGEGDQNELFIGQSNDGYVHEVDVDYQISDSRLELPLLGFEPEQIENAAQSGCTGSSTNTVSFLEGDSSLSLSSHCNTSDKYLEFSTFSGIISAFPNKKQIKFNDKIQLKLYPNCIRDVSLVMKLFFDDGTDYVLKTSSYFDLAPWDYFDQWHTDVYPLHNIAPTGVSDVLLGKILTKIQFSYTSNGACGKDPAFYIDDFRIIQSSANPVQAYRYTKPLDLGVPNKKTWDSVYLSAKIRNDSEMKIDVVSDYGEKNITRNIPSNFAPYERSFYVNAANTLYKYSKDTYGKLFTSSTLTSTKYNYRDIALGENFVAAINSSGVFKMELSTLSLISHTTIYATDVVFDDPSALTIHEDEIYIIERKKNSILQFNEDLVFISSYSLSVSSASDVVTNGKRFYLFDETNRRIMSFDSDFTDPVYAYVNSWDKGHLAISPDYLYATYKVAEDVPYSESTSKIVIEQRDPDNLRLLNRVDQENTNNALWPTGMDVDNDYLFHSSSQPVLYRSHIFQRYDANTLKYVSEEKETDVEREWSSNSLDILTTDGFSMSSYHVPYKSIKIPIGTSARWMQLRFRVDEIGDRPRLFDQTFLYYPQELR
jgi:hypothetical protein